jgi:hypothetical protein
MNDDGYLRSESRDVTVQVKQWRPYCTGTNRLPVSSQSWYRSRSTRCLGQATTDPNRAVDLTIPRHGFSGRYKSSSLPAEEFLKGPWQNIEVRT